MSIAIIPDSMAYIYGDNVFIDVYIYNVYNCNNITIELKAKILNKQGIDVDVYRERKDVKIINNSIAHTSFEFSIPSNPYGNSKIIITSKAEFCNNVVEDTLQVELLESISKPVETIIVWHHHQPPNYLPNGKYFSDYPFRWVWYNLFEPYTTGGPYYVHAKTYKLFPDVKTVVHLSPSLLYQWKNAIENGYVTEDGITISKDDIKIELLRETLNMYRELASMNSIEILTSVYAHTILGYLLNRFGMEDIIREELDLGMRLTQEIMGVTAKGVWTPEMAWNDQLIKIYSDSGIEYTILCGKSHFSRAIGDKETIYEPYEAVYNGSKLKILFRDQEISDIIGFNNNFPSESQAVKGAQYVISKILGKKGIVVIALDGENWMIFSKYPRNTYPFFYIMYKYLNALQKKGFIKTSTAGEVLKKYNQFRKLLYIPTTSWLNSFYKWDSEIPDQKVLWYEVSKAYDIIRLYKMVIGSDNNLKNALWSFYHVLDSDYWWTEFWNPRAIKTWLTEVYTSLSKTKILY
jgi:alpha-amylase/alpha-mannosidase (GH57 family)